MPELDLKLPEGKGRLFIPLYLDLQQGLGQCNRKDIGRGEPKFQVLGIALPLKSHFIPSLGLSFLLYKVGATYFMGLLSSENLHNVWGNTSVTPKCCASGRNVMRAVTSQE